jgi:cellulose synthase operon protein C
MRKPFRKSLLSLAVAQALGVGLCTGWPAAALATDTPQPSAAAAFAQNRDIMRELIELKSAVVDSPDDAGLRFRLGKLYLRMGDAAGAEKELERAIRLGRDDYQLRLLLGEAWLQQGKFGQISRDQDLGQPQTAADRAALAVLRGTAEMVQGRYDDARDFFDSALGEVPAYAPALVGIVEVLIEQDEMAAAQLELVKLRSASNAEPADILRLEGNIEMKFGRPEQAVQRYLSAVEQRPGDPILLRGLARAQFEQGDLEAANDTINQLLRRNPTDGDAVYLQAQIAYRQQNYKLAEQLAAGLGSRLGVTAAGPLYIAGAASYFDGSYNKAAEYLSRYVRAAPNDAIGRQLYGASLLMNGDAGAAHDVLKALSAAPAEDVQLLTLLGVAATLAGFPDEGAAHLEQALALEPDNAELRARLAVARLQTENREDAIAELRSMAADARDYAPAEAAVARLALASGDYDAAFQAARRVTEAVPDQVQTRLVEALALMRNGELDEAEVVFQQVLAQEPEHIDARSGMADILLRRGEVADARVMLEKIAQAHPDLTAVQLNLARIETRLGLVDAGRRRLLDLQSSQPRDADVLVALAANYQRASEYVQALAVLEENDLPDSTQVQLAKAEAELALDRLPDAVERLEAMVQRRSGLIPARIALARAYARAGRADDALREAQKAVEIAPKDPTTRIARAYITLSQPAAPRDQLQTAADDVGALWKRHPQDATVQLVRALALLRYPNTEVQAVGILLKAHQALQTTQSAVTLAVTFARLDQLDAARDVLDSWLNQHPQDNYARRIRAFMSMAAGQYAAAAEDFETALEQGASWPGLSSQAALALALSDDMQSAQRYIAQASAETAGHPAVLHAQGLVAQDKGQAREAATLLQQAMDAQGGSASPRLRLDYAKAQLATGNAAEARAQLTELLARPDAYPERQQAEELLKGL